MIARTGADFRGCGRDRAAPGCYASDPFDNPICFVDSQTLFTGQREAWGDSPKNRLDRNDTSHEKITGADAYLSERGATLGLRRVRQVCSYGL